MHQFPFTLPTLGSWGIPTENSILPKNMKQFLSLFIIKIYTNSFDFHFITYMYPIGILDHKHTEGIYWKDTRLLIDLTEILGNQI